MPSSEGPFLSVDGPSGVGKTTTVRALAELLRDEGRVVHVTAEPSEGPIGRLARELTETVHEITLACLYAADRYHHLANEVFPHMNAGRITYAGWAVQRIDYSETTVAEVAHLVRRRLRELEAGSGNRSTACS